MMRVGAKLFYSIGIDRWRRKTIPTWNIVQGKTHSSGHYFLSGIYNIGHCMMTWWLSKCEQGSCTFLSDTAPQSIQWKRSKRDRSLRVTRDCYSWSSSSSMFLTLAKAYLCFAISRRSSGLPFSELSQSLQYCSEYHLQPSANRSHDIIRSVTYTGHWSG